MSKLDDILEDTRDAIMGVITGQGTVMESNTKDRIKALFLELANTSGRKADLVNKIKAL